MKRVICFQRPSNQGKFEKSVYTMINLSVSAVAGVAVWLLVLLVFFPVYELEVNDELLFLALFFNFEL